jgi:DNA-binding NarL/FixJ family response regulator
MLSNTISTNNFYTFSVERDANHFAHTNLNTKSMKVFLVDDSIVIRQRLMRLMAEIQEVTVIGESGNAQEAIVAILRQKPDVVLLDIHLLDDGSGIQVLQTIKQSKPAPKVIILTNYPYPQYRQRCLEAGADFFFVKSTEFDQVVPTLRQLIQRSSDAGGSAAH